jgi:hypothetical protein
MRSFKEFFTEKYILGLEEDIIIDDVGTISAKLDTGNGAYNVLHGEDLEFGKDKNTQEPIVRFTTVNAIRLEKPIQDKITINLGGEDNYEERPVCLFDCVIGGKKFPNTLFSIGNRANNDHKVLIGKGFIKNELNALIDVALKNVADENIEVNV